MSSTPHEIDDKESLARINKFNIKNKKSVLDIATLCEEKLDDFITANEDRDYASVCAMLLPSPIDWAESNQVPMIAFNEAPECCLHDYITARGADRPGYTVSVGHAELRLISACSRLGVVTENATLVLNWFPCYTCAVAMVEAGVKTFIGQPPDMAYKPTQYNFPLAQQYLINKGVRIFLVDLGNAVIAEHYKV